jgi:hypothetical protein
VMSLAQTNLPKMANMLVATGASVDSNETMFLNRFLTLGSGTYFFASALFGLVRRLMTFRTSKSG